MLFRVEGHEVRVEVEKEEIFKSKHSELNLKKLKIHFQVYNPIKIPKTIKSVDDHKNWKVVSSSYYYTEGNPVVRYIFEIEEIEVLKIESLMINNTKLNPYSYEEVIEESIGDKLLIKANSLIQEKEFKKIEEWLNKDMFISVVRLGISENIKEMKLSKILWSKNNAKSIKCHLTLIEKLEADFKYPDNYSAEFKNIQKILSNSSKNMDILIKLLLDKKIVSSSEIREIKKDINDGVNIIDLYQVDDLDHYLTKYQV
ncbi:MAG: hypothetical protein ACP5C3_03005 [Methanomicrobiales archaeon]